MKDNSTFIAVVLDRSGSMMGVREATINGLNEFIKGQKEIPGEATFTLAQFDHEHSLTFDSVPLASVPTITNEMYVPRGNTALFDAIGKTIDTLGEKLASMAEAERPGKVIVVVQTDGEENASKLFTAAQIKEKIKHQTDKYSWQFVFLGANIDAATTADSFGISKGSTLQYNSTIKGSKTMYASLNRSVGGSRKFGSAVAFTPEDRKSNNK